jgi:hypothetical protein
MPTVLRIGPYRFHFYADELGEPAHIHVARGNGACKFWLRPVTLARNFGLPAHEVRQIERLIFEHRELLETKYNEFHNH